MRWEWEGGTATSGKDRDELALGEPAREETQNRSQPTHRSEPATRIASVSPVPSERWQADGDER